MKIEHDYQDENMPTRVDKTLAWLANSRDTWKAKCMKSKLSLKRQTLAVKRLRECRDEWKSSTIKLKHELVKDKQAITSLQRRVKELEAQIKNHNVKKKP